ncbi:YqeG family HAD IIIA-type phosphatase [Leptolyngbyaceae cyanobacterium CCMR0082]|uniref:YqeG family HAD IIIA-type phosphatase n=2 Tax=Adonisia turfae TaxID=2950184 RepID=A0A6M0SDK4_9CYAN|nr:YqeG family HAD IIIA-type phosphatase [Adonisia turfae]NEZ58834.1 YqeG family HAD IIIA-type phosphatase [Adonisia turfae CCMR0081]NEZ66569.1 YqeG family HAD IIIA-type phosphatase [Adonisia turfae CCMR0082]
MTPWGRLLQPDLALDASVLGLTPELIQQHQLKGLILDVDETLVPFQQSQPLEEVRQWLQQMQTLVPVVLVSNNLSHSRIRRIAETLEVPFYTSAGKPSRRKLRQAAELMKLPHHEIAMVGDRLFTDVLGGNRLGLFTVLVEPMVDPMAANSPKQCLRNAEIWLSKRLGVVLADRT